MRDSRDNDDLRAIVDDVHYEPVTHPDVPLIFVTFQLFASWGSRVAGQHQNLARLLDFERVLNHAGGCASGGGLGTARNECPFPSGAIQTQDRPRSLAKLRVFS